MAINQYARCFGSAFIICRRGSGSNLFIYCPIANPKLRASRFIYSSLGCSDKYMMHTCWSICSIKKVSSSSSAFMSARHCRTRPFPHPTCRKAVLRIHDILGWIRILDPDPAIFVIDLQDVSKKLIF
jgi:hypothetical protein